MTSTSFTGVALALVLYGPRGGLPSDAALGAAPSAAPSKPIGRMERGAQLERVATSDGAQLEVDVRAAERVRCGVLLAHGKVFDKESW